MYHNQGFDFSCTRITTTKRMVRRCDNRGGQQASQTYKQFARETQLIVRNVLVVIALGIPTTAHCTATHKHPKMKKKKGKESEKKKKIRKKRRVRQLQGADGYADAYSGASRAGQSRPEWSSGRL
jgi:hypothetical protein